MPSLLDQVLDAKDSPAADSLLNPTDDKAHKLDNGAVIYDSTIAAINRILALNPHLHKRPTGVRSRPYELYNGHTPVDVLDRRTFLSLLKSDWEPKSPYQSTLVENYVMELAPTFSRDGILVTDSLLWDRTEGVLKEIEPGSVHSVS